MEPPHPSLRITYNTNHAALVSASGYPADKRGHVRHFSCGRHWHWPLTCVCASRDMTSQLGRMDELDQIIKQKQEEGFFSLEGISKETLKKEVRVEELMVHVNARIERSERYARFFSVSIFFVIYIIALYMQRTPSTAFKIENSFQRALLQSLPVGEEGAQFLSGEGDMYGWCDAVLLPPPAPPSCHSPDLVSNRSIHASQPPSPLRLNLRLLFFSRRLQDKLLSQMFTDPSCGDGICDRDLGEVCCCLCRLWPR